MLGRSGNLLDRLIILPPREHNRVRWLRPGAVKIVNSEFKSKPRSAQTTRNRYLSATDHELN
jgi:hypothetical protein